MNYSIETSALDTLACDCLIIGVYTDKQLSSAANGLADNIKNIVNYLINRGDIAGTIGESLLINAVPNNLIQRILLVGLGDNKPLTAKDYRKVLAAAINNLKKPYIKSIVCSLADCPVKAVDTHWKTRQIVEVFSDALYSSSAYKSNKDSDNKVEKITIHVAESDAINSTVGLQQGLAIASGVKLAKQLADAPANICTPSYLAQQAIDLAAQHDKLDVTILEEADMQALGMGSLLAVSRGSRQPAKLINLNYAGGEKSAKPIVLIGKGLTFDAGGISIKPALGMDEMKYDMCGGAAVIGALAAAAQMQLPLNIIGLVPASENMPDGDANKPGDILTSMSGKTIEVLNTDAEGRLILCDTLTYCERFNPDVVIDLATLTGACIIALGRVPSGLFGNDDELCNDLIAASDTASDSVWRLPLWEEYQEQLKSNFADLANIGGKDAGSITAACFLANFAENLRWAHLDIAGTAWRTGQYKGATGRPVPLLMQYLLNRARG
jgi:leucyl aminopeptidase